MKNMSTANNHNIDWLVVYYTFLCCGKEGGGGKFGGKVHVKDGMVFSIYYMISVQNKSSH